ncbi:AIPR family protein [Mariprofundus erugo]|uniref:AIPR family protein n=1 Tax=Mariprofundus erugo TaxID=2528639 RepID=A0A5R9GS01_9PROT|nr:AIPR family protein [Mariprofundus erugo]TLS68328.1 AIPR family protein [Mariprofundus erugo]
MRVEEFLEELSQMVVRRGQANNLVDTLAFVHEVADRLVDDPAFGEFEFAEWQGPGPNNRTLKLHGYTHYDDSDGSIGLVIGKWQDLSAPETLTSTTVKQLIGYLQGFVTEALQRDLSERIPEVNPAYELACLLSEEKANISRIRLHIFTNLTLSKKFKEELEGEVAGIPIERHVWDLQRLSAIYQSSREREAVEIKLTDFSESGIPCINASGGDAYNSYLCVIKANLLADLFERYGSRLLEGNVRSFLGMRGNVNKGIKRTIRDQPHLFFPYNNGIAATASEVDIQRVDGHDTITRIVDLQIVNGGQTTASILDARKKDKLILDNVTVQMKLTNVTQSEAHELIPKIAEYANTQNKVNIADFFANHPFHRKIEEISRRILIPAKAGQRIQSKWFYERARGQFQNARLYLTKAQMNAFDSEYPFSQVITKTDLAKYGNTLEEKPYWVSLGAQKNFLKFADKFKSKKDDQTQDDYWERISPNFGDGYFRNMVSVGIVWKELERIVSGAKGSWYEGGYRPQIVTYTFAKLVNFARSQGLEVDLDSIWNNQALTPELHHYLEWLAPQVQGVLINPPAGEGNVGEWCKKERCWQAVVELEPPIIPAVGVVIEKETHKRQAAAAKKEAVIDDGIAAQIKVVQLGGDHWRQLKSWNLVHHVLSPTEEDILRLAAKAPERLSAAQAILLLKAFAKADLEGFKPTDG